MEIHGPHDPEYEKNSSTDKLVEIWGKGLQHLNSLWKVWKDDYLLNPRESGTKLQLCSRCLRVVTHASGISIWGV